MQTGLSGLFSRVSFQHRLSTCVSTAIVCNHMHQQLRGGYKFQALAAKLSSDTGKNSTKPVNAQRQNVVQQGNFTHAIPPPPPHTHTHFPLSQTGTIVRHSKKQLAVNQPSDTECGTRQRNFIAIHPPPPHPQCRRCATVRQRKKQHAVGQPSVTECVQAGEFYTCNLSPPPGPFPSPRCTTSINRGLQREKTLPP